MKEKVVLVIVDGLNYRVSQEMGYMKALVEGGKAAHYKVRAELPTLSRPLYETILTGVSPVEHGVVSNQIVRRSREESVFSLAREAGLKTGAAAYYWMSELYNRAPFNEVEDFYTEDREKDIQYGRFYKEDNYPDSHLFLDGEWIRRKYDPNLLMIHPMNVDDAGHKFGEGSPQYRKSARDIDEILSKWIPLWMENNYKVIVTADHGMNGDMSHRGGSPEEREVPLWLLGKGFRNSSEGNEISQLQLAPIICRALNIRRGAKMTDSPLDEVF